MTALIARVLPAVEGLCGALPLLGLGGRPILAATAALATGFAVTLVVAYRNGVATGCRCFGVLDSGPLTPVGVMRAVVLAGTSIGLLAYTLGRPGVPGSGLPTDGPAAVAAALGVLAACVYVASFAILDQVYEFERGRRAVLTRIRGVDAEVGAVRP